MRTLYTLYLYPNNKRRGYFVYNIATIQRSSACRVIGINEKPIPMTDLIIELINKKSKEEKQGIEYSNINKNTTVNDYKERGIDSDSDFEDDCSLAGLWMLLKIGVWSLPISQQHSCQRIGQRTHPIIIFASRMLWWRCYAKSNQNIESLYSIGK